MSIIWLASYPKSGSTWLRAVLTSYLSGDGSFSINGLVAPWPVDRRLFDDVLGIPSTDLSAREILRLRPLLHELVAAEWPHPALAKVHDANIRTEAGPLFPRAATAGAVYLIRNPLDVAVSYAHHQQWSIDRTIASMNRNGAAGGRAKRSIHAQYPDVMLSWSANVASWADADLPVHVARYEELLARPAAAFGAVVRFIGLDWCAARLERAVDQARFDRLRGQERDLGFRERQPTTPSFFRSGRTGGWRRTLTPKQVRTLVAAHGAVMDRFGYLAEAEAYLAGRS